MNYVSTGSDEIEQERELANLIVTTLSIELHPSEINRDAPLFAEGLGLDSIDILEIALAVSQVYGIRLRSDDKDNDKIFRSLRTLNQYIQKLRSK